MKGSLHVLDRTGHTTIEWDTEQRGRLDPQYAEKEFQRLVNQGWLGVGTTPGQEHVQVKEGGFDPKAYERVTMRPPMMGG